METGFDWIVALALNLAGIYSAPFVPEQNLSGITVFYRDLIGFFIAVALVGWPLLWVIVDCMPGRKTPAYRQRIPPDYMERNARLK